MSKNNPQYEDSIVGERGEIVVVAHDKTIQIRCIYNLEATSVFLYPHQIPNLVDQLEEALEEHRQKVYIG